MWPSAVFLYVESKYWCSGNGKEDGIEARGEWAQNAEQEFRDEIIANMKRRVRTQHGSPGMTG